MTSVGEILRRERQAQGREMAEIAEELCITQRYLRAIEEDDLKNLPGSFFYKSFVKQYAAIVGVDERTLQPGIDALTVSEEPLPLPGGDPKYPLRQVDPIVADTNRRYFSNPRISYSVAGLAAVLLICSGFYAWYNKPAKSVNAAVQSTAPQAAAVPVAQTESKPADGSPVVAVTTTTGPDGVNHVVLNLSATEKTWLSITSEGKQIFSGVLEPSQTKTLTAADVAKVKVGNAGGLEVRWNGKAIGPIGPRGQVRTILFTPENFQILAPPPATGPASL